MPIFSTLIITNSHHDALDQCLQSVRAISKEIFIIDISYDSWVETKKYDSEVAVTVLSMPGISECEATVKGILKATNAYVIWLYATEVISDALKNHLALHAQNLTAPAYSVLCVSHIGNEPIRSGPFKPTTKTRIIDKTIVHAACGESGFVIVNSKDVRTINLRLELHCYQFGSIQEMKLKTKQNALLRAEYLFSSGVKYCRLYATLRILWAVFYAFFITFAFTDIPYGWQTAVQHVRFTYLMHQYLRLLHNYGTTERRLTKSP